MSALRILRKIYVAVEANTPLRGPMFRYRQRFYGLLLPTKITFRSALAAAIAALFGLKDRRIVRGIAKKTYMAIENHTPLQGPMYRYRHRIYSYLPPRFTASGLVGAALLAMPGASRIFSLLRLDRFLFRAARAATGVVADMPGIFRIDVDCQPQNATSLQDLMAPGFRRAAFEIYRNALYVGMVNAMQEVVVDAASGLAMDLRQVPFLQLLEDFSKPLAAGEDYERLLTRAIDLDPKMAEPRYMLGRRLLALGREDEALHHFRLAATGDVTVKRAPDDLPVQAKAYFEIGSYHLRRGATDKAIPFLERAIELSPEQGFAAADIALGKALLESGNYERGAERFLVGLRYVTSLPTLPPFADSLRR